MLRPVCCLRRVAVAAQRQTGAPRIARSSSTAFVPVQQRHLSSSQHTPQPADDVATRPQQAAHLATVMFLASEAAAMAADGSAVTYDSSGGGDFIKNAAGVGYVLLVAVFLYRVLRRRAKRAKEEKLAGQTSPEDSIFNKLRIKISPQNVEEREATALDAFLGAAQAGVLGFGMFVFTSKMTALISSQGMPDAYTARNITVTVRTILQGLAWLATFIFCLNSVGLLGLSVQMLLFPDSLKDDEEDRARRRASGPQLPKVPSLTSNPAEVKRAFDAAERQGKKEGLESSTSSIDD